VIRIGKTRVAKGNFEVIRKLKGKWEDPRLSSITRCRGLSKRAENEEMEPKYK
jgi:hypothetical protein